MNEMLTWMESHPLPFACTTNFGEHLDPATLRRFVFKVRLDYLTPAQVEEAFRGLVRAPATRRPNEPCRPDARGLRGRAPEGVVPLETRRARSTRGHALRRMRRKAGLPPPDRIPAVGTRGGTGVRPFVVSVPRSHPLSFKNAGTNAHFFRTMHYERIENVVRLAVRLQGTPGGLTLDDIRADFSVSRSTAERMRNAVEAAFGPLDLVDTDDAKRHWRLRSDAVRRLVAIAPEELAEFESAASALERVGLEERAGTLRDFATKVRATLRTESLVLLEAELEALVQAEGLAMRAGPRPRLDAGLLSALREAITTRRLVKFRYLAQSTGLESWQRVRPLGLLYGNRAFLVASSDWGEEPRLWRLANMSELRISEETFERDPDFDLARYAKRSFGTFQEEPVEVVLRFAPAAARDASNFVFHPDQATEANDDGSLTVRFEAGGIDEMCWHLFTWGESVTIEKPLRLRRRLSEMSARLAAHHVG